MFISQIHIAKQYKATILICFFAVLATSCSAPSDLSVSSQTHAVEYSIIYLVHGDADYLFFDENGNPRQADEEIIEVAQQVGEQAQSGEVFIFHQKPEKRILWLFPKKDRRILHYRNGKLVQDIRYSPQNQEVPFTAESEFYQQHASDHASRYLLYFGHEIPDQVGHRYHRSRKDTSFNERVFIEGVQNFLLSDDEMFELSVISTCNNGTPQMAHLMKPFSHLLLASPQNLHLSHFDTQPFNLLEENLSAKKIAESIAKRSFERLSETTQTAVTISLFDLDQVSEETGKLYQNYLDEMNSSGPVNDFIDCSQLNFYDNQLFSSGVKKWYHPPRFGRNASKTTHSGWGCRPDNNR